MKLVSIAALAITVAGCASSSKQASVSDKGTKVAANTTGGEVICRKTKKIGSNMPTKICFTKDQREKDRAAFRNITGKTGRTNEK